MAPKELLVAQPLLLQCLRNPSSLARPMSRLTSPSQTPFRALFSSTSTPRAAATTDGPEQGQEGSTTERPLPFYKNPDPKLVTSPRLERRLVRMGQRPVGSRRRRAALGSSPDIPFEELPYQCFQDALNIIREDREEKLGEIQTQRARIERLRARTESSAKEEQIKQDRLSGMMIRLERLKVLADINLPNTKRRFEDGLGMEMRFYSWILA